MPTEIQCPKCYSQKGFPGIERGDGKCAECYGTGAPTVVEAAFDAFNILTSERSKCFKCKGTGICQTCYGTGIIEIVPHDERPERGRKPDERRHYSSAPEPMDGATCLFWAIGITAAAIAVLFAVLTVIVTMPIWVGAIAVSVITAFLYSARRIREIAPRFEEARLTQVQRKKKVKVKVDPEFLQRQIRWNPDLLIAGGSGILYALLLGGVLVLYNTDRIGKTMFGIAVVAGGILAWKSGRKILELRISEAVLTARQIPATGPRNAAQIGFGLSCAAASVILFLIIASFVNGPAPMHPFHIQVETQPRSPSPATTVTRTLTQADNRLRNAPASPPPQTEAWRQPPKFAQTTPTAAPSPTSDEQFRVFVDQSRNFNASSQAVSNNQVSEFITRIMDLEKTQQIEAILRNYASRVKYFDNGTVDHAFIRKDKSDYYLRWPVRTYETIGNIHSTSLGQNLWEIRVPTKFHVANQRGEWIDGDVLQILTVNTSDSHWVITAEAGEVTRREKGTGQVPAGDTQAPAASGSSQAIGGGAYRGKGAVHRIPDLKGLVGKELSNAWLYGEFAFEQHSGDIAVCRTAATVLFVGKGTTRVNIEFERGFSVSDRILRSMRDPQLPLTFMLRAGASDPIRLLRVRQNRDGTLEAFARSPIRLDMQ